MGQGWLLRIPTRQPEFPVSTALKEVAAAVPVRAAQDQRNVYRYNEDPET